MDKLTTAQKVADQLFDAERKLDEAFESTALLMAEICAARQELGLALKVGAPELRKLSEITGLLAQARQTMGVDVHQGLNVLQRVVGVRTEMTGGGEKGPNNDSLLSLVSDNRAA